MADTLGWLKKLLGIHRVIDTEGNTLPSTHTFNFSGPTGAVAYNTSTGEIDIDLGASPIDLTDPDFVDPGTDNSFLYTRGSTVEWREAFSFPDDATTPTITQDDLTTDVAPQGMLVQSQSAYSGATANVDGSNLTLSAGEGATGGEAGNVTLSGHYVNYLIDGGSRARYLGKTSQTTDVTPLAIPVYEHTNNVNIYVTVKVHARRSGGSQVAYYRKGALFKRVAGVTTQVGATETLFPDIEDDAAWNCTLANTGDEIQVTVTGAAGVTIAWDAFTEVIRGSS